VDCTTGAYVARLAGARFTRVRRRGDHDFHLVAVGNDAANKNRVTAKQLSPGIIFRQKQYPVTEFMASFPAGDLSFSRMAAIEQEMRDRTWDTEQVDSADHVYCSRQYRLNSRGGTARETSRMEELPVPAFVPETVANLFVLGQCADIPEKTSREIFQPFSQIKLGEILGSAAFVQASNHSFRENRQKSARADYYTKPVKGVEYLDGITGEVSEPLRPNLGTYKVHSERTALRSLVNMMLLWWVAVLQAPRLLSAHPGTVPERW
jgi:hypothetical protein